MKTLLLSALMLATASAAAADKADPARVLGTEDLQPQGSITISDLLADSTFQGSGSRTLDFNDANGNYDLGLRVFRAADGGYWVAGQHSAGGTSAIQLAIAKLKADGTLDGSYNGSGRKTFATDLTSLRDVAIGASDVLYFVGTRVASGFTDTDIQVRCIDANGAYCDGFGTAGVRNIALDRGDPNHHDDIPTRIVWFASSLYIVGETDIGVGASDHAAFALKLSGTTGTSDNGFGNTPVPVGLFVLDIDHVTNGRDVAFDVLAYSPSPFATRLVMVGQTARGGGNGNDIDGFAISIDGLAGIADGFIDDTVFADLGADKQDALLHVMRRRDGGFVVAGTARDDSASPVQYQLLMAAYKPNGGIDTGFGDNGDGRLHKLVLSGTNIPYGLAERAGNRDIVVGLNMLADLFGDGHPIQGVVQLGRNGHMLHALAILDFAGSPQISRGADLVMDGNAVVVAGTRSWSQATMDADMTVGRFVANDSIFADAFGGQTSD